MKTHTYATDKEINDALHKIIPNNHSIMEYPREDQIQIAGEIVRITGKSVRINAMNIHPSTPVPIGERVFQAIVGLVAILFIAVLVIGVLTALVTIIAR